MRAKFIYKSENEGSLRTLLFSSTSLCKTYLSLYKHPAENLLSTSLPWEISELHYTFCSLSWKLGVRDGCRAYPQWLQCSEDGRSPWEACDKLFTSLSPSGIPEAADLFSLRPVHSENISSEVTRKQEECQGLERGR